MKKKLTKAQKEIIENIKAWQNVLITWWAWTWKSFLLQQLKEKHLDHLAITASTWIAAVNVWGLTLHSFAGLWLWQWPAGDIANRIMKSNNPKFRERISQIQSLAIDEVSMISKELFNKLDEIFKIVRKNDYPFWWVQMILFWDFLQLPPIVKYWEKTEYLFESNAFKNWYFTVHILSKIFRQKNDSFISLLNNIRFWNLSDTDIESLSDRSNISASEDDWIKATKIVTHNSQADIINSKELENIDSKSFFYNRKEQWDETCLGSLRKNCLAPEELELKIWAQVMCLRNTYQDQWIVNWSLWFVEDFNNKDFPIVRFSNWKSITIEYDNWAHEEYDPELWETIDKANLTQIPLRLAYAITVHKSQWMTLDKIECDLWDVFAQWQIYVAMSRVKTLEWLYLKRFNLGKIQVNSKVLEFYKEF